MVAAAMVAAATAQVRLRKLAACPSQRCAGTDSWSCGLDEGGPGPVAHIPGAGRSSSRSSARSRSRWPPVNVSQARGRQPATALGARRVAAHRAHWSQSSGAGRQAPGAATIPDTEAFHAPNPLGDHRMQLGDLAATSSCSAGLTASPVPLNPRAAGLGGRIRSAGPFHVEAPRQSRARPSTRGLAGWPCAAPRSGPGRTG